MNLSGNMMNDEFVQQATMEKIAHLQCEILQSPREIHQPHEALVMAYEMLTDEQKMAFILARGALSLFSSQKHHIQQMRKDSDTEAGQILVLC